MLKQKSLMPPNLDMFSFSLFDNIYHCIVTAEAAAKPLHIVKNKTENA